MPLALACSGSGATLIWNRCLFRHTARAWYKGITATQHELTMQVQFLLPGPLSRPVPERPAACFYQTKCEKRVLLCLARHPIPAHALTACNRQKKTERGSGCVAIIRLAKDETANGGYRVSASLTRRLAEARQACGCPDGAMVPGAPGGGGGASLPGGGGGGASLPGGGGAQAVRVARMARVDNR